MQHVREGRANCVKAKEMESRLGMEKSLGNSGIIKETSVRSLPKCLLFGGRVCKKKRSSLQKKERKVMQFRAEVSD